MATRTTGKRSSEPAKAAPRRAAESATGQHAPLRAIKTKQTKTQIVQTIVEETGLNRKDVIAVLTSLGTMAKRHVMKQGSGEFSVPELGVKIRRVQRKARTARNPRTGEPMRVPARTSVKAGILKPLKEAVI